MGGNEYLRRKPAGNKPVLPPQPKALYIAYFTGALGNTIGLFYIGDKIIAGVDAGGIKYSGTYSSEDDGALNVNLTFEVRPGEELITGTVNPNKFITIPVHIILPNNFSNGQTIRIETPAGPVNARFEKLHEIG